LTLPLPLLVKRGSNLIAASGPSLPGTGRPRCCSPPQARTALALEQSCDGTSWVDTGAHANTNADGSYQHFQLLPQAVAADTLFAEP
jgi:hypothetical protein